MSETQSPSFFARIGLAIGMFFRLLFDATLAGRVQRLTQGAPEPAPEPAPAAAPPPKKEPVVAPAPTLRQAPTDAALQLLGLLQREGRLVDFLMEDMGSYPDADIGAAARVVHDQCRKALLEHVQVERIRSEEEGARVTVPAGFQATEIRLTGNLTGAPPFSGTLAHAGWRATGISLPQLSEGHDVRILAPAEVEL